MTDIPSEAKRRWVQHNTQHALAQLNSEAFCRVLPLRSAMPGCLWPDCEKTTNDRPRAESCLLAEEAAKECGIGRPSGTS